MKVFGGNLKVFLTFGREKQPFPVSSVSSSLQQTIKYILVKAVSSPLHHNMFTSLVQDTSIMSQSAYTSSNLSYPFVSLQETQIIHIFEL